MKHQSLWILIFLSALSSLAQAGITHVTCTESSGAFALTSYDGDLYESRISVNGIEHEVNILPQKGAANSPLIVRVQSQANLSVEEKPVSEDGCEFLYTRKFTVHLSVQDARVQDVAQRLPSELKFQCTEETLLVDHSPECASVRY